MSFTLSEARRRVPALAVALAVLLGLLIGYSAPAAHATPPDEETVTTYNSQGYRPDDLRTLSRRNTIVLVQEAGPRPTQWIHIRTHTRGSYEVWEYEWPLGGRDGTRHVYWLSGASTGGGTGGRVNLMIVTHRAADEVFVAPPGRPGTRPALGVRFDRDIYYSVHAQSGGGFDAPDLLANISNQTRQAAGNYAWTAAGDWNRDPDTMRGAASLQGGFIYRPAATTQQSGGELDYMITLRSPSNYFADRAPGMGSDHYPVEFRSHATRDVWMGLRSASDRDRVLGIEGRSSANGTRIVPVTDSRMADVTWRTRGSANDHVNLVNNQTQKCIDVVGGNDAHNGSALNEWDCAGQLSQEFIVRQYGGGALQFLHARTGLCVTMMGGQGREYPALNNCDNPKNDAQNFIPEFRDKD
ncbi:RICIN domain-containing protein [Streptomyces sp. RS10V-4]|uniref:RICIN domain-containing protein n=1 Tax=Streptomyces rhizoryzae TaxID=2932493 RepID=UPI0020046053|nr:RICIN domain-containing protein [Streptomyces rhizoryzae]MCK7626763.1 RICIN domain-containing protein [Streptomyces rhizoryzae]